MKSDDCLDCQAPDATCPGHPKPPKRDQADERRRQRAAQRARRRRDHLAAQVDIFDMLTPTLGDVATATEVRTFLGVKANGEMRNALYRNYDEMRENGWDVHAGTFTQSAVLRLCLLMRPAASPRVDEVANLLGVRERIITFNGGPTHVEACQEIIAKAKTLVGRVREDDPAKVWHKLGTLDRYTLTAITVALAAMVPEDRAGLISWLSALTTSGGGAAAGLALLVPDPAVADGVPLTSRHYDTESETA